MAGSSELPGTPSPGYLTPTSGFCVHCTHLITSTHMGTLLKTIQYFNLKIYSYQNIVLVTICWITITGHWITRTMQVIIKPKATNLFIICQCLDNGNVWIIVKKIHFLDPTKYTLNNNINV